MKKSNLLKSALLAIAGVGLFATHANATLTYSSDDLFIGVYSASSTTDYLIDIGQASNFLNAASGSTTTIDTIGNDLTTAFGSGWATDQSVKWAVFGTDQLHTTSYDTSTYTNYATKPEGIVGTLATGYLRNTQSTQASASNAMIGVENAYKNGSLSAEGGYLQSTGVTNSLYSQTAGGSNIIFANYTSGDFSNGTSQSVLDLFRMVKVSSVDGSTGDYVGSFSINDAGTVSYTVTAVPEPSTYGLFILGGAVALAVVRRFRKVQA